MRWAFRLIPKGERQDKPQDYFISEETKRLLMKVARMLTEHYLLARPVAPVWRSTVPVPV